MSILIAYPPTVLHAHAWSRMAALLRSANTPCTVCVNVSAYDLTATDLPDLVRQALESHGAAAEDLQLELTETSVSSEPGKVRDALLSLQEVGVFAAIDDFGTGYASLSYLSTFPVRELKIDQMFVTDILGNDRHHLIVRSTISMAHQLGLEVVAEGAEDLATIAVLREDGCDRVQGYAISRPLPEAAFIAFLDGRKGNARAWPSPAQPPVPSE